MIRGNGINIAVNKINDLATSNNTLRLSAGPTCELLVDGVSAAADANSRTTISENFTFTGAMTNLLTASTNYTVCWKSDASTHAVFVAVASAKLEACGEKKDMQKLY